MNQQYNDNDSGGSADSYSDFAEQLEGQTYTAAMDHNYKDIPKFDDSDDYSYSPPPLKHDVTDNSDIFSNNFTTSNIMPDYKQLDQQITKVESDSSENGETSRKFQKLPEIQPRRPPARSVAALLHTSSSDDDDQFNPAPKPKPKATTNINVREVAESVSPKTRFSSNRQSDKSSTMSSTKVSNNMSGNMSGASRPMARSVAASAMTKKWTKEVAKESPLDQELKQLQERETRLREFSRNDDDDERAQLSLQAVAEKQYAQMLKRKCPNLVQKKTEIYNRENKNYIIDFNNDVLHWSRDMIAEENERIKERLESVRKELADVRKNNEDMRKEIDRLRGYDDEEEDNE